MEILNPTKQYIAQYEFFKAKIQFLISKNQAEHIVRHILNGLRMKYNLDIEIYFDFKYSKVDHILKIGGNMNSIKNCMREIMIEIERVFRYGDISLKTEVKLILTRENVEHLLGQIINGLKMKHGLEIQICSFEFEAKLTDFLCFINGKYDCIMNCIDEMLMKFQILKNELKQMKMTSSVETPQIHTATSHMNLQVLSFRHAASPILQLMQEKPQVELISITQMHVTSLKHTKCERCALLFNNNQIHTHECVRDRINLIGEREIEYPKLNQYKDHIKPLDIAIHSKNRLIGALFKIENQTRLIVHNFSRELLCIFHEDISFSLLTISHNSIYLLEILSDSINMHTLDLKFDRKKPITKPIKLNMNKRILFYSNDKNIYLIANNINLTVYTFDEHLNEINSFILRTKKEYQFLRATKDFLVCNYDKRFHIRSLHNGRIFKSFEVKFFNHKFDVDIGPNMHLFIYDKNIIYEYGLNGDLIQKFPCKLNNYNGENFFYITNHFKFLIFDWRECSLVF